MCDQDRISPNNIQNTKKKKKIYCDDHISLSSTTAVQIWIISYKTSQYQYNIKQTSDENKEKY